MTLQHLFIGILHTDLWQKDILIYNLFLQNVSKHSFVKKSFVLKPYFLKISSILLHSKFSFWFLFFIDILWDRKSKTVHILRHIFHYNEHYFWKKFVVSFSMQFVSQLHTFSFTCYILIYWLDSRFHFQNAYKTFMLRHFWNLGF